MTVSTTQVTCIQKVTAVNPSDGAFEVTFEGGLKALLTSDHPDQEIIRWEIERSLRHSHPVGVLVDQVGQIVDLRYAIPTGVQGVENDEENLSRLKIGFWGYSPVCYLQPDHPEFERIRTILQQALASNSRVWLAPRSWPIEDDTEVLIMDVRPMTPAGGAPVNGTT